MFVIWLIVFPICMSHLSTNVVTLVHKFYRASSRFRLQQKTFHLTNSKRIFQIHFFLSMWCYPVFSVVEFLFKLQFTLLINVRECIYFFFQILSICVNCIMGLCVWHADMLTWCVWTTFCHTHFQNCIKINILWNERE